MRSLAIIIICSFLLLFVKLSGQAQAVNFTRPQYGAGSQNWTFEQDQGGCIYVANNEGLLTYNGVKWEVFPMPNQTIVRFISFGKDGRLYAGGQDEIGYFEPAINGKLVFHSLQELIDAEDRQFADIWNIVPYGDDVFFRSFSRLFRLHNNKITTFRSGSKWDFLGIHKDQLLAHDKSRGLLVFKNGDWQILCSPDKLPPGLTITSIIPFQKQSLLTTASNGLLILAGEQLVPFKLSGTGAENQQYFTSAQAAGNGTFLVGTYDNGVYAVDSTGKILETFSKNEGLNSNNVKCIFNDRRNNIWLGLEDGISFLTMNSPVKLFNPRIFNGAAGYGAAILGNKIFFALANGIYEMPSAKSDDLSTNQNALKKITGGLSWEITKIHDHLFTGRDDGFFEVKSSGLTPVDPSTGYWIFKPLSTNNNSLLFAAGNYLGVSFFRKENNGYVKETNLDYLNTSARFLEYDSLLNVIWISHPYRGVYKISLPGNAVKRYTDKDGLPSTLNNHVFKIKNKVVIATVKGVYVYNPSTDHFELETDYDKIFNGISIRYLQDDKAGNLWFVHEKNLGVADRSGKSIIYFPELQRKILSGFENIFPVDSSSVVIGGEQGFFHINYNKYLQNKKIPDVYIRNVTVKNGHDSVLYAGFKAIDSVQQQKIHLHHKWNSFHFEFAAPYSEYAQTLEYSYYCEEFDNEWSDWTKKMEKDYTNLSPGNYIFRVKARNNLNEESSIASFSFTIAPPWYNTVWASIGYIFLFVSLLYFLYKQQEKQIQKKQEKKMLEERMKHEEKERMLAYRHQLEMEKSEKELMQVKNEKLESELASTAMNLVQKKEFLLKLKDEINKLNKAGQQNIDTSELKKILRSLTAEDKLDEEWEQFSIHFNKVHGDFLIILKNKFPGLKAHELKLCAYLRMNLSSKEIAQLLSISVRGVEISRYRLRKKLQLQPKEDLFQFLLGL
jgi:DNA-binding CsgD family transcriptional regulator